MTSTKTIETLRRIGSNLQTVTGALVDIHTLVRNVEAGLYPRPVFGLKRVECSTKDLLETFDIQKEMYGELQVHSMVDSKVIRPHPMTGWPFNGGTMPSLMDMSFGDAAHKAAFMKQICPDVPYVERIAITTRREPFKMRNFVAFGLLPEQMIQITQEMSGVTICSDGYAVTAMNGSEDAIERLRMQGIIYFVRDISID